MNRVRVREFRRELLGFASAGLCAYVVDLMCFVWLRGPAGLDPVAAKVVSALAGCAVAYAGNALGTYRERGRGPGGSGGRFGLRQCGAFLGVNAVGAGVQLLCLVVSHHGLGLTSPRADTVSGAGVGMVLATVLRFWGTRTWVFRARPVDEGRLGSWTG